MVHEDGAPLAVTIDFDFGRSPAEVKRAVAALGERFAREDAAQAKEG